MLTSHAMLAAGTAYFAIVFAAGFVLSAFIAFTWMVLAESTSVLRLRRLTIAQYFSSRDPVSGTAYILALAAFALMPFLVGRF